MGSNAGDGGQPPYDGLIYPNWTHQTSASDTSGTAPDVNSTTAIGHAPTWEAASQGTRSPGAGGLVRRGTTGSNAQQTTTVKRVITPITTYTPSDNTSSNNTGAAAAVVGQMPQAVTGFGYFHQHTSSTGAHSGGFNDAGSTTSSTGALHHRLGERSLTNALPGNSSASHTVAFRNTPTNANNHRAASQEWPMEWRGQTAPLESTRQFTSQQVNAAFYPSMEGNNQQRAGAMEGERDTSNNHNDNTSGAPMLSAPYNNYPTSPSPTAAADMSSNNNFGGGNYYNNNNTIQRRQHPYSESTHSTTLQRALTTMMPPSVAAGTATTVPPFAPPTFIQYNNNNNSEPAGLPTTMSAPVMPGMMGSPSTTQVPRVTFTSSPRNAAEEEAGLRRRGVNNHGNSNSSSSARGFLSGVMHRWLNDTTNSNGIRGGEGGEDYDEGTTTNSSSGRSRQETRPMHQLRFGCPEDDLPLLEELGIVPRNIAAKAFAVLNPFRRLPPNVLEDTDLAGPIVFAVSLAFLLSLSGKIQFSAIYGLCVIGVVLFKLLLTLMHDRNVPAQFIMSALGYALLPNLFLAWLRVAQYWVWWLSLRRSFMPLTIIVILWSSWCATTLLVKGQGMETQRYLILYPVLLFYAVFAALTIF